MAIRNGEKRNLKAEELVVGDIVFVKVGDKTPAGILYQVSFVFQFYAKKMQLNNFTLSIVA